MFDSGLGGLTVFRSLIDLLPAEPVTYFGDTGRFPYGPRPAHEVVEFSIEIGDLLVDAGAKLLVVACNSATSAALDVLEDRYDVPVVGVVEPGVRVAAAGSASSAPRGRSRPARTSAPRRAGGSSSPRRRAPASSST